MGTKKKAPDFEAALREMLALFPAQMRMAPGNLGLGWNKNTIKAVERARKLLLREDTRRRKERGEAEEAGYGNF